ncbi:MAG: methyltransferase domain-containing protein [Hyphomonadaceae bacterium]|nr:methyltransferase domain-containing protein [Hyphomonadaceae bacterium]
MRIDVHSLKSFYASPLGEAAARMMERRLKTLWPDCEGRDVLGIGYPMPLLERYRAGARRVAALAPAAQGAQAWAPGGASLSALGDETRLPFMDSVFDRVLLVHALEEAENTRAFLREVWRVTAPEGRLLVVAANRLGLWARGDATPFGHGRPFTRLQLGRLLSGSLFEPTVSARALFAPPFPWCARFATPFERVGEKLWPAFGGLVLMEAVKRLYVEPDAAAPAKTRVARAAAPAQNLPAEAA